MNSPSYYSERQKERPINKATTNDWYNGWLVKIKLVITKNQLFYIFVIFVDSFSLDG